MRVTQISLPLLAALATAACARQQASYYAIDPATQQPVPVVQQYAQPPAPPAQYAQAAYQQPAPAANGNRGLFSSPQVAQQSYARSAYAQPAYQPPAPQQTPSGRGLFNTFASEQPTPAYAPQAYAPPPGAPPAYAQQTYAQPRYASAQTYTPQPAPSQYRPPPYGTYAAATPGNPFAQARWY